MQKDAGRDGDVERLGAGRERDGDPPAAPRAQIAALTPGALVAHDQRDRRAAAPPRRPTGSPSAAATQMSTPRSAAHARNASASVATAGSRNAAPMLPRSTFGLVSSAVPLSATTPAAPRPSAVRSMVPTLPGSCTASSTRTTAPGAVGMSASDQTRGSTTATTPCGCSVSASASSSAGGTSTRRTPRAAERELERLPAGSTFQRRRDRGAVHRCAAASASSTRRTPSASARPRRSRPRRRARSRIVVSSVPSLEVLTG